MMDTAFAKVVVDVAGRNHILIDGEIISLSAITPDKRNNEIVKEIVRAMRNSGNSQIAANSAQSAAYQACRMGVGSGSLAEATSGQIIR